MAANLKVMAKSRKVKEDVLEALLLKWEAKYGDPDLARVPLTDDEVREYEVLKPRELRYTDFSTARSEAQYTYSNYIESKASKARRAAVDALGIDDL